MELTNFPSVLKRTIAAFLDHRSAVRFTKLSKSFRSDVALSTLTPPYELIYSQICHGETMTGDIPVKSVRIPIFGMGRDVPHTVCLKCRWKDQGWGNRKGKLFVVAQSSVDDDSKVVTEGPCLEEDENVLFGGGRIVYKSPVPAAHHFENLEIMFTPRKNESYHLWFLVGGGGGHLLIIEDLCVHTLVFDDSARTMRTAYSSLYTLGVISSESSGGTSAGTTCDETDHLVGSNHPDLVFFSKLLKEVVGLYYESHGHMDAAPTTPLASFKQLFENYNLPITDPLSLMSMLSICDFFLQYLNQDTVLSTLSTESFDKEVMLPSFSLVPFATWEGDDGDSKPKPCCRIPFVVGRTKSVRVSCTWQDHGSGKSKGMLFILAKLRVPMTVKRNNNNGEDSTVYKDNSESMSSSTAAFEGFRLVWESPIVSHEPTPLEFSFAPNDTELYYLYQDSGDYGDLVHVNSLNVQVSILDDNMGRFEQSYRQLLHHGALDNRRDDGDFFQTRLILAALVYLQGCNADATNSSLTVFYQFFESHRLATDERSLRSLRELVQNLLDFKQQQKRDTRLRVSNGVANQDDDRPFRMFSVM